MTKKIQTTGILEVLKLDRHAYCVALNFWGSNFCDFCDFCGGFCNPQKMFPQNKITANFFQQKFTPL